MPSDKNELYEFTQTLGHALEMVKLANEVPEFVLSKARDINAEQTLEALKAFENNEELFKNIAMKAPEAQISDNRSVETKKDLYNKIDQLTVAIENVKSSHYRLMLNRYIIAANLAEQVQTTIANILLAQQELGGVASEEQG